MTVRETWIRVALAIICAAPAFWFLANEPNPKVPFLGGLLAGVGGSWLIMKITALALPKDLWTARREGRPSKND